jgi:F-type H+-transporting ATPase subunit b
MSELINLDALFIQTINLAVIVYVLYRFVFKPYLAVIDSEEKKAHEIEKLHKNAESMKKDAEEAAQSIVDEAKKDAKTIRAEARSLAKEESNSLVAEATKEADSIRAKGLADVAAEKAELENELKSKVLSVAIKLNSKLFGTSEKNEELLSKLSKDL